MDAVFFLIVLLVISCGLSLWTAATARADRRRVNALESVVTNQGRMLSNLAGAPSDVAPTSGLSDALAGLDSSALSDAQSVLSGASPDELAAAADMLKKLGIGG